MTILTVGSGQQFATLAGAVAASHDGDTIYVQAGTYVNDFATVNANISIIGVGGMVNMVATVPVAKGIITINPDINLTIDHFEFSGAKNSDNNGTGIRYQGGQLTVTNSYFHDNQDGLLGGGTHPDGNIVVDHSEFDHNGAGDGQSHNLYIAQSHSLTVTNSYLHDAVVGHELKSRAEITTVENNRIADYNGTSSYDIDVEHAGVVTITGNYIQQGPHSQNPKMINYGGTDYTPWPTSSLTVENNVIVNNLPGNAIGVMNRDPAVTATVDNNHVFGLTPTQFVVGPSDQSGNDTLAQAPTPDTSHPWAASPWDKLISGTAGADVLANSSARDLFVGGAGADTFQAGVGRDSVADFSHAEGDKIDLSHIAGFSSLADVLSHSVQSANDTVITLGGSNSLTLMGIARSGLTASDFLFGSAPVVVNHAAPTDMTLSQSSIAENSAKGTVIGTFSTVDADPTDTFTYSLISNPGNLFAINGANLVVAGSLDYETSPSDPISVRVTDANGATYDHNFTIQVKNVPGVTITGSTGNDVINSGSTVAGQPYPTNEDDNINGGAGNDSISGLGGNDTLSGSSGADTLSGGLGNDKLLGGSGNDVLLGDGGNDTLTGGPGADTLTGGSGADCFVFTNTADTASGTATDVITDFSHSQGDHIDLSGIDANVNVAGNQAFTFIGTQAFHKMPGELHYAVTESGLTVSGDVNGDGVADFSISVAGVSSLVGSDFIL